MLDFWHSFRILWLSMLIYLNYSFVWYTLSIHYIIQSGDVQKIGHPWIRYVSQATFFQIIYKLPHSDVPNRTSRWEFFFTTHYSMQKTKTEEFKLLQRIVQERAGLNKQNDQETIRESVFHLSNKSTTIKQTKPKTKK